MPSFSNPFCLSDWNYFLNQNYENNLYQLYTLMVSQNVMNGITSEISNCIKENDVHSSFLNIKSSKSPTPRTQAILKFLIPYQLHVINIIYNDTFALNWLTTFINDTLSTIPNDQCV